MSFESQAREEEQQLLSRSSTIMRECNKSVGEELEPPDDLELDELAANASTHSLAESIRPRWLSRSPTRAHRRSGSNTSYLNWAKPRRRRSLLLRSCRLLAIIPVVLLGLIAIYALFFPSYSHPPQRYTDLRTRVQSSSSRTGSANAFDKKVMIVASLYDKDGKLLSGHWGEAVLDLVDILGPSNVYLSVYENDPDSNAKEALARFGEHVRCNKSLVAEHLDLDELQHFSTPDGTLKLKRIAYLAEVRNRALRPLQEPGLGAYGIRFDKLLYLNDVIFDPVDAASLLFSTNTDESTGETNYRAACAVDFINAFKFYDTYATRDLEGFRMGVPFYPWFAGSGKGISRQDVLAQKDAVRVKSCWGGMVAYEAKWFQPWLHESTAASHSPTNNNTALRFRAETDNYWDASECCLINADLSALSPDKLDAGESGIYMNPYIRVAYRKSVLHWLPLTKRFERLYPPFQTMVNWIAERPSFNPRRLQQPGEEVIDRVWVWDDDTLEKLRNHTAGDLPGELHGTYKEVRRVAMPGQFCGHRKLSYINEYPMKGEKNWANEQAPTEWR